MFSNISLLNIFIEIEIKILINTNLDTLIPKSIEMNFYCNEFFYLRRLALPDTFPLCFNPFQGVMSFSTAQGNNGLDWLDEFQSLSGSNEFFYLLI